MRARSKFAIFAVCALLPLLIAATGGGFPSRPKFQAVSVGAARSASYVDQVRYPMAMFADTNERNELIILNKNSGALSRGGIVVGVEGQGAISMRGLSSAATTGGGVLTDGPMGAQGIIHTGTPNPLVIGTNDMARLVFEGNGAIRVSPSAYFLTDATNGIRINNAADAVSLMTLSNTGALTFNGQPYGLSGTFTYNVQGLTSGAACTAAYTITGKIVALTIGTAGTCSGTSNTVSGPGSGATDLPVALRPASNKKFATYCVNNFIDAACSAQVNASGSITMGCGAAIGAGCSASGTKGISPAISLVYGLD